MHETPSPLDNVIWGALSGPHAHLARGDAQARRYDPEVAPFGAVPVHSPAAIRRLLGLVGAGERLALTSATPPGPQEGFTVAVEDVLRQMVLVRPEALAPPSGVPIQRLSPAEVPAMLALTQETKPGPFGPRTIELGDYFGIFQDGTLVAMAGERLRVPGFTEMSAVCVAASCRGRGYASALVGTLARSIRARGETPFLHVAAGNGGAFSLYRKMGFEARSASCLTVYLRN